MTVDPVVALKAHQPQHDFLIAIDSDGCAFDTMEIKQKECFIPNIVKFWDLQPISKYVRQAAEFVNLYSKWRGTNRFPALVKVFDLLGEWDAVIERGFIVPDLASLRRWIAEETKLGNPQLEAWNREYDDSNIKKTLDWSKAVNASVADIVKSGMPPFPHVRESLEKASERADLLVCSQTPAEALVREWEEQDLARYVFAIAGQELGTKSEHIALVSEGRYPCDRMLMIGDALGDKKAAQANKAFFYPILPGAEDVSWRRFHDEALERFFAGTYGGAYEEALISEFDACLPEVPPWRTAR